MTVGVVLVHEVNRKPTSFVISVAVHLFCELTLSSCLHGKSGRNAPNRLLVGFALRVVLSIYQRIALFLLLVKKS